MTISNDNKSGVTWCHICEDNPQEKRRFKGDGLAEGKNCPICFAPTCRYHLSTVRWKWVNDGSLGADQICRECKRTYRHRSWDTLNREWIS